LVAGILRSPSVIAAVQNATTLEGPGPGCAAMDRSAGLPLVTTPDLPSARAESGRKRPCVSYPQRRWKYPNSTAISPGSGVELPLRSL
jgi:hypothetical protein